MNMEKREGDTDRKKINNQNTHRIRKIDRQRQGETEREIIEA